MAARRDYIGLALLALIVALTPSMVRNEYYLGVLVFAALNCLSCTGLSLLMGYAGQISMGHAAFVGLGAYATAILTTRLDWSPWAGIAAGAVLAGTVAMAVGVPSLRLRGHYLAMATLGFGSIVHIVSVAAIGLTGGPGGISGIPPLAVGGWEVDGDLRFFYFSWGAVILGLFFAVNLIHSRAGRGLRAIHGSEDAAAAAGVHTAALKIQVFVVSAVYAAAAGGLYACYVGYIDPGPFDVMHSVLLVTMVAVGGMQRIWGAIVGAVLLSLLPEMLSMAGHSLATSRFSYDTDYDMLIHGGILLAIMLFLPEGLFGGLRRLFGFLGGRFRRAGGEHG